MAEAIKEIEDRVFVYQAALIEKPFVFPQYLKEAARVFQPKHFEAVYIERSHMGKCGWPICSNPIPKEKRPKKRIVNNTIVDEENLKYYCCRQCYWDSSLFSKQISTESIYHRSSKLLTPIISSPTDQQQFAAQSTHLEKKTTIIEQQKSQPLKQKIQTSKKQSNTKTTKKKNSEKKEEQVECLLEVKEREPEEFKEIEFDNQFQNTIEGYQTGSLINSEKFKFSKKQTNPKIKEIESSNENKEKQKTKSKILEIESSNEDKGKQTTSSKIIDIENSNENKGKIQKTENENKQIEKIENFQHKNGEMESFDETMSSDGNEGNNEVEVPLLSDFGVLWNLISSWTSTETINYLKRSKPKEMDSYEYDENLEAELAFPSVDGLSTDKSRLRALTQLIKPHLNEIKKLLKLPNIIENPFYLCLNTFQFREAVPNLPKKSWITIVFAILEAISGFDEIPELQEILTENKKFLFEKYSIDMDTYPIILNLIKTGE